MSSIYYRLIAIWVLCEAMLGGIIHAARIPVSGLIVGSCAVICICLIAWHVPKRGAVLKATLVVAIFKMMLSPQASLPAYFAVFFQGAMGELLFWNRNYYRLSCFLLAILALVESGLQRILVLIILYGNDLWTATNDFINKLTKEKIVSNYSQWIAAGYVAIHFIAGIIIGWWASVLPARIEKWRLDPKNLIVSGMVAPPVTTPYRKRRFRAVLFVIWLLLLALYIQSWLKIGSPLLPSNIILKILLRSVIIVLTWVFVIGPLLKQMLHGWLQRIQVRRQQDIQEVIQLLPSTRALFTEAWNRTKGNRGWKKLRLFGRLVLVNALNQKKRSIYILAGQIQTGKTTSLLGWAKSRKDISGILTPIVNGRRVFHNIKTGEEFPMESVEGETEVLQIGRFNFSKKEFVKASEIIRSAIHDEGILVIDEIGPLELRDEGFSEVLQEVLSKRSQTILLVIRDGLVGKVKEHFKISDTDMFEPRRH